MMNEEMKLKFKFQQDKLSFNENDSLDLKNQLDEAERKFKELDRELQPLKQQTEKLYTAALESTGGVGINDPSAKSIKTAFSKLPATIPEINEELQTATAKIYCMSKNDDGENVSTVQQNIALN